MADETILIDIEYNTDDAVKNVDALADSIEVLESGNQKLIDQQKEIRADIKKTDEVLKEEGKTREDLTQQYKKNSKEIEINKTIIQKEKKERKDNIKLITSEKGSRNALRQTIAKLRKERNALNVSTEEGAAKSEELRIKIDKLDASLKDSGTEFEKNKLGIGGYKDAIKDAFGEMGVFGTALSKAGTLQQKFGKVTVFASKAMKTTAVSTSGVSKALKVFKMALIATGIGAIVVALGSLVAMFNKTQAGTNKITKALAQAKAVVDSVIGRFTRLGEAVEKLFKGDFKGAAESAKTAFAGLKDEIVETVKEAGKLQDLIVLYKNQNRELDKTIAILEARRTLERDIAEDDTKGFAERDEFYKKEAATIIEIANTKKKLAQNNLTLIEGEINALKDKNLKISDEQKDALKDAQIALEGAETERVLSQRDSEELRRRGARDLFEYELDFIIDLQEKQKLINTEKIKDESLAFNERRKILDETTRLSEESFQRQQKAVEEFTGKKIDFDALAAESDAKIIFNKLKLLDLDDITLNRSREIIQERKLLLNDFATLEKQLGDEIFESTTERLDAELELFNESLDAEIDILHQEVDATIEAEHQKTLAVKTGEMSRRDIIKQSLSAVQDITGQATQFLIDQNNAKLAGELAAAGDNEEKKAQIEKKYAKINQKLAIKQAIVKGSLVVLNALLTQPFIPAGLIAAGAAAVATGFQVATVKNEKFNKGGQMPLAKRGMKAGTFSGASHSSGGIPIVNGLTGRPIAEVEGNENFYVVNKKASSYINSLSDINQRIGGGVPLSNRATKMADGGQADVNGNGVNINDITQKVIANLPPIVVQTVDIKTGLEDRNDVLNVGVV